MKRLIRLIPVLLCLLILSACADKKQPELADDLYIKLSVKTTVTMESYKIHTLNIEIHQDGAVRIYADSFYKWHSDEKCPETVTEITDDEAERLKQLIFETDLYNVREDIGNRDDMYGVEKFITLYTVEGEHTVGGLNPSNRAFLKVFDYINDIVREEVYTYSIKIDEMQLQGFINSRNKGVKVTDNQDRVVISGDMIAEYAIVNEDDIITSTDTDASAADADKYMIAVHLNEEAADAVAGYTEGCNEKMPAIYYLYIDNVYEATIYVDHQITDGVLYLSKLYMIDEAETLLDKLSEYQQ